jgi:hypothetical protein
LELHHANTDICGDVGSDIWNVLATAGAEDARAIIVVELFLLPGVVEYVSASYTLKE